MDEAFPITTMNRPRPIGTQTEAVGIAFSRGKRPRKASSTQMSSSSCSHRNARPCSRSWTLSSSGWGAFASSGYFVAGKLTNLWSASSSQMRRPSIQHRKARADDDASLSMDLNISIDQLLAMLLDEPFNFAQVRRPVAIIGSQRYGSELELGLAILTRDMDMRWLVAFPAIKMEPIRTDAHDRWHGVILGNAYEVSTPEVAITVPRICQDRKMVQLLIFLSSIFLPLSPLCVLCVLSWLKT
jgi:hypothetical protein